MAIVQVKGGPCVVQLVKAFLRQDLVRRPDPRIDRRSSTKEIEAGDRNIPGEVQLLGYVPESDTVRPSNLSFEWNGTDERSEQNGLP
jgi:hypothetical protein